MSITYNIQFCQTHIDYDENAMKISYDLTEPINE